jgi:hypothetical protein
MSDTNRTVRDAALACTFMVIHQIRHAFRDEDDLEAVFKEIFDSVTGAIQAALAAKEHEGGG